MLDDWQLSETAFKLGYGTYYVGYLLFAFPSKLLLRRVGERLWIARIMMSWGEVSSATMFAYDDWTYCGVRILLCIADRTSAASMFTLSARNSAGVQTDSLAASGVSRRPAISASRWRFRRKSRVAIQDFRRKLSYHCRSSPRGPAIIEA
jgi:hypothetical protein